MIKRTRKKNVFTIKTILQTFYFRAYFKLRFVGRFKNKNLIKKLIYRKKFEVVVFGKKNSVSCHSALLLIYYFLFFSDFFKKKHHFGRKFDLSQHYQKTKKSLSFTNSDRKKYLFRLTRFSANMFFFHQLCTS